MMIYQLCLSSESTTHGELMHQPVLFRTGCAWFQKKIRSQNGESHSKMCRFTGYSSSLWTWKPMFHSISPMIVNIIVIICDHHQPPADSDWRMEIRLNPYRRAVARIRDPTRRRRNRKREITWWWEVPQHFAEPKYHRTQVGDVSHIPMIFPWFLVSI